MNKFILLTVPLMLALSGGGIDAFSQEIPLGIEKMFSLAEENSETMKVYRLAAESAAEELKTARLAALPDIEASLSVSYLGDGRIYDRDFSNGMKAEIPHFGNNFSAEISQILYAGGAVANSIKLADYAKQMADLDVEGQRREVRFLLLGLYLDLYKTNNQISVLEKNIELTDRVLENMKARLKSGTAIQNDLIRYELQKETLKLQLCRVTDLKTILNHRLVTMLHLPEGSIIIPQNDVFDSSLESNSIGQWQTIGRQNNTGLQQAELAIRMSESKRKLEMSEMIPKIAFSAGYHLDGPVTIEIPALNKNFQYWYIGVGIKYNFASLYKHNRKYKSAKINVLKAQEQLVLAEENLSTGIQTAYTDYMTAYTELTTQEKSVELADENYRVIENRYNHELALITDMIDAGNMKLSADLSLVNARINLIYNYYKIKYTAGTL